MKVFFADAGSLDQLQATLREIAATSDVRLAELEDKVQQNEQPDVPFPERRAINQVALHFQVEHERTVGDWARWALDQVDGWNSPTDPGSWVYRPTS